MLYRGSGIGGVSRLVLILLGLCLYAFSANCEPLALDKAMERVWGLSLNAENHWTEYEIKALFKHSGVSSSPPRYVWVDITPGSRTLEIKFWDPFEKTGIGRLRIHIDENAPAETLRFINEQDFQNAEQYMIVNGVVIRPRSLELAAREVYVADVINSPSLLDDRLRLSVSDSLVLNPWHRSSDSKLRSDWGDQDVMQPSVLQNEAVEFLKSQENDGQLKKGCLVQMPTGTGKTETVFFYLESLRGRHIPFRLLWLTNGIDLLSGTKDRFTKLHPDEQKNYG